MRLDSDQRAEGMSLMGTAVTREEGNGGEGVDVGQNEAEAEVVPGP